MSRRRGPNGDSGFFAELRKQVVTGRRLPGSELHVEGLMKAFGVSAQAAGQAIATLIEEGLAAPARGGHAVLTPLDLEAARDARPIVGAVQGQVARLATPLLNVTDLRDMAAYCQLFEQALAAGDRDVAMDAELRLHDVALKASGNRCGEEVLHHIRPSVEAVQRVYFETWAVREIVDQHRTLVAAFERRDADEAQRLTQELWAPTDEDGPGHLTWPESAAHG